MQRIPLVKKLTQKRRFRDKIRKLCGNSNEFLLRRKAIAASSLGGLDVWRYARNYLRRRELYALSCSRNHRLCALFTKWRDVTAGNDTAT
jgi:hypothetical protein